MFPMHCDVVLVLEVERLENVDHACRFATSSPPEESWSECLRADVAKGIKFNRDAREQTGLNCLLKRLDIELASLVGHKWMHSKSNSKILQASNICALVPSHANNLLQIC
jgi:hypothetical protein